MKKPFIVTLYFLFLSFLTYSQAWRNVEIANATKSDIEIGSDGQIHIAYINEQSGGDVSYLLWNGTDTTLNIENVQNAYPFGPVDLELLSDNTPYISYTNIESAEGNGEISIDGPSGWMNIPITSPNADGWDGSLTILNDQAYYVSVDATATQLELALVGLTSISVDSIFSAVGITNRYGTDIAANNDGQIIVSYVNVVDSTLNLLTNNGTNWTNQVLTKEGTNPDIAIGADSTIYVAYVAAESEVRVMTIAGDNIVSDDLIGSVSGLTIGMSTGTQEPLDIEVDAEGNIHLAYADPSAVRYAFYNGSTWSNSTINGSLSNGQTIGRQAALAVDATGTPHITYQIEGTGASNATVNYAILMGSIVADPLVITCPADTVLACDMSTDTTVTGLATANIDAAISYSDSIMTDCPDDLIIMRSWVASTDTESDTCVQMITQVKDTITNTTLISDSLAFSGMCLDEIISGLSDSIALNCGAVVDTITLSTDSTSCGYAQMTRIWTIIDECADDTMTLTQNIVATDIPLITISDTTITETASADSTGSISLNYTACGMDSLSFSWSNGATTDSIVGLAAGDYSLVVSAGMCVDSFSFSVSEMMAVVPELICPQDTVISCELLITPEFTGQAIGTGYDSIYFDDIRIQDCPMDIILERYWIGVIDSTNSDTCVQMITYAVDSILDYSIRDTMILDGICLDDLADHIRAGLELPCNLDVDSIDFELTRSGCDTIELIADWAFSEGCLDSVLSGSQTIIITHPIVVEFDTPMISLDTITGLGSIDLSIACSRDSLSYVWSDGSDSSALAGVAPGTYSLVVTNSLGCIDSFEFVIAGLDTMVIDTMMMDSTMFSLICPADTTISCDSDFDPSVTGMAQISGFDTLFFVDTMQDSCPMDLIITRQWIAQDSSMSDTCTQTITVERGTFGPIDAPDTLSFTAICAEELDGLLASNVPTLSCGTVLDSTTLVADTSGTDFANYTRTWYLSNDCLDSTITVAQTVLLTDIQALKIDNIVTTGDPGDTTGAITYDIICAPDSISFLWSNGSTDTTLSMLAAGDYTLTVSDSAGVLDSFLFTVADLDTMVIDTMMMDSTMFSLICPADTTISCDSDFDPSVTGMAQISGFDTLFFVDTMQDSCPMDLIITRQWIAQDSSMSDTCTQTITVERGTFGPIDAPDTLSFTAICSEELDGLLASNVPTLSCGTVLDSTTLVADTSGNDFANYTRTWYLSNDCLDSTITIAQTVLLTDIQALKIDNIVTTGDPGDSTGAITYDIICAPDSISFLWSNGSTDTTLSMLPAGDYTLTVSDSAGVLDSFLFTVADLDTMIIDTMMMDSTMFSLICPADTTISCDSDFDPSVTGMAQISGFDTLFFVDSMQDSCPMDLIITRQWIAQDSSMSDTCTQTITVGRGTFGPIDAPDTLSFTAICSEELDGLLASNVPTLSCGTVLDSTTLLADTSGTDFANYTRTWYLSNDCLDSTISIAQTILVTDIQSLKIDNIVTTGDPGDTTGAITYDIICAPDSISFLWSNGSTDTTLSMLAAGDYTLTVSDTAGVLDSFLFTVADLDTMVIDTMMMDSIMFSLICPADTTISCDSDFDPSVTGMAQISGFDTLFFVDSMQDSCPMDLIITRQWIAQDSSMSDTCTQTITVERDGLSKLSLESSLVLSGICVEELLDGSIDSFDLACGVTMDTIVIDIDSMTCDFVAMTRQITFSDACLDSTITLGQSITLMDIPVAKIADEGITGDVGDSLGIINPVLYSCSDSLLFEWSTGSTDTFIDSLKNGDYSVVLTNENNCFDTFDFSVPFIDTTAFFIHVFDRSDARFDVDSIAIQRSNGSKINAAIERIGPGSYSFTTEQTMIEGDQLCMTVDADPAADLSVLDLVKGQRHVLGLELACEDDQLAGDVNFTGNISGADLAVMQRVILAIDTTLPDQITYIFTNSDVPALSIRREGCISLEAEEVEARSVDLKAIKLGDYQCTGEE